MKLFCSSLQINNITTARSRRARKLVQCAIDNLHADVRRDPFVSTNNFRRNSGMNLEEKQDPMRLRNRPAPEPLPPEPTKAPRTPKAARRKREGLPGEGREQAETSTADDQGAHGQAATWLQTQSEKVRTIRALWQEGKLIQREIGKQFGGFPARWSIGLCAAYHGR